MHFYRENTYQRINILITNLDSDLKNFRFNYDSEIEQIKINLKYGIK